MGLVDTRDGRLNRVTPVFVALFLIAYQLRSLANLV